MRLLGLQSTMQAILSITCTILAISAFWRIAAVRAAPALGQVSCTGPNRLKLRMNVALRGQSDWRDAPGRGRNAVSNSFNRPLRYPNNGYYSFCLAYVRSVLTIAAFRNRGTLS
jgi:hypothetical protein